MEKIKIITDSTLDLPAELIREKDIEVLPLLINFGEESYLDGIEITTKEMIDKIDATGVLPTTAQVTPNRFEESFKKYLDEGYKIVALTLSSDMSGTYQSACIAKDMLESDDIVVIDSRNVTSGLGLLVLKACQFRDKGLGIKEIEAILPHRHPFLLIDRIDELEPGMRAVGIKAVTFHEEFFAGHFPGEPVMPGVLILEALAQVGAVAILSVEGNKGKTAFFGGVDNVRFRRKVVPGDVLTLTCEIIRTRGNVGVGTALASVNGERAVTAEMTFVIS